MDESIFEAIERSRLVDTVLLVLAIAAPAVIIIILRLFRTKMFVACHRHHWALAFVAAPMLFLLWKAYNAVADRYGLDSVFGLFVNVTIFAAATAVMIVLDFIFYAIFTHKPRQG
ncbi:MAG: hypothetical protein WCK47_00070 [bacterium]|nr:hypothetical protein [Candidatus Sumerlaeota bacterium]